MSRRLIPLSTEDVCAIHDASIARFGGAKGVRDEGLLASALAQPFQSFGGKELYSTMSEKAARYAFGLISNHPFADSNKRTGAAVMGAFLRLNGLHFQPKANDLLGMVLGAAAGSVSYDQLAAWIAREVDMMGRDMGSKGINYDRVAARAYNAPINGDGLAVLPTDWDDWDE